MGVSWREDEAIKERRLSVVARYRKRGAVYCAPLSEEEERKALRTDYFKKAKVYHRTKAQKAEYQLRMF